MQRPDFELIAEILAYQRTAARVLATGKELEYRLKELDLTTYAFAWTLADTNRLIDRKRFLRAAGMEAE